MGDTPGTSNMSEMLGYGFFPTLMTIAFLSRSWSVRFGWQGIPATVRALLRVSSAASAGAVIRPDERGHAGVG